MLRVRAPCDTWRTIFPYTGHPDIVYGLVVVTLTLILEALSAITSRYWLPRLWRSDAGDQSERRELLQVRAA